MNFVDVWQILGIIGTIAFALSGAIVAIDEDFDILGIYILGLVTAFGGGALRNLMIGLPVKIFWSQGILFNIALFVMTLVIIFPKVIRRSWVKLEILTDAIGLAAFSIQGALHAMHLHEPVSAVITAAIFTGAGGGIIRDILAGRKPSVLRSEIYAGWSIVVGLVIYFKWADSQLDYYLLVIVITVLRVTGNKYNWHLPKVNK